MFRTPITDLVSSSAETEGYHKCHKLSRQLALCKEAYGLNRAPEMCKAEEEDFKECMFGFKQRVRVQLMQKERERQFKNGEREQKYAEPAIMDGFNMRNPYS
uniref:Putative mitochondrial respiratory chain complex i n=1 Tax=Amblyomma tuberculatum TaxID=48802 RepID=A0A6M2E1G5_9ACAR